MPTSANTSAGHPIARTPDQPKMICHSDHPGSDANKLEAIEVELKRRVDKDRHNRLAATIEIARLTYEGSRLVGTAFPTWVEKFGIKRSQGYKYRAIGQHPADELQKIIIPWAFGELAKKTEIGRRLADVSGCYGGPEWLSQVVTIFESKSKDAHPINRSDPAETDEATKEVSTEHGTQQSNETQKDDAADETKEAKINDEVTTENLVEENSTVKVARLEKELDRTKKLLAAKQRELADFKRKNRELEELLASLRAVTA